MSENIKTQVRRVPERGAYDRDTAYRILDDGFTAHVGITGDGQPYVVPMLYARREDELLLHGSVASRLLQALSDGIPACVTVTHMDGLVFARSAFESSANYRSVMVMGTLQLIDDFEEKSAALEHLLRFLMPGRDIDARGASRKEIGATTVLRLPIESFSAKTRVGEPKDKDADYALDVWAGVLPFRTVADAPIDDSQLRDGIEVPEYVRRFVDVHDVSRRNSES